MSPDKKKLVIRKPKPKVSKKFEKNLNDEQLKVIRHQKGSGLIIAGAGTGKTRALTYRVAYLLEQGVAPESIVLVTFTKKAAQEMIERVEALAGGAAKKIKSGTFHHLSNLIIRRYAKTIGFTPSFTILDRKDQQDLMKNIRASNIPEGKKKRYPKSSTILRIYSTHINLGRDVRDILETTYPQYTDRGNAEENPETGKNRTDNESQPDYNIDYEKWIKDIIATFKRVKQENNVMDFDDLMIYLLEFLVKQDASKRVTKKIKHVLVDEYQDVNLIQARIVEELSRDAKTLMVVGDDAQAIYSFRGADFSHMLNFPDKNEGCKTFKLVKNYRSTPQILSLANQSIKRNIKQFQKNLEPVRGDGEKPALIPCSDLTQEADALCQLILNHRENEVPFHKQAVLFRSKYHSIYLERALIRWNIPYVVRAGVRFFERAHIKDVFAFLVLLVNPTDEIQWQRVLNLHPRISDLSARKVIDCFQTDTKYNYLEQFVNFDLFAKLKGKRVQTVGKKALQKLQVFYRNHFFGKKGMMAPPEKMDPLPLVIKQVKEYAAPLLRDKYKDKNPEERLQDIDELIGFAADYDDIPEFLSEILTQMNLTGADTEEALQEEEEPPLVISTVHQAKGLEWDVVYVMNLVEGRFPSSRAIGDSESIEEERRLFYVACTRARDNLYLTYPRFVSNYGYEEISEKSRFVAEIEDEGVFEIFDVEEE